MRIYFLSGRVALHLRVCLVYSLRLYEGSLSYCLPDKEYILLFSLIHQTLMDVLSFVCFDLQANRSVAVAES